MQKITVGKLQFRYIVGANTVGIITSTGKKHIPRIAEVRQESTRPANNGTPDYRVTPEEVASYIINNRLV